MDAIKVGLLATSGTLAVGATGTLWWLLPMTAYGLVSVYEHTTTEEERPRYLTVAGAARALVDGARSVEHWRRTGELPGPAAALAAPGAAAPAIVPIVPTAAADDVDPLLTAVESRPHRLFIGFSGGGKTTLMHHLATSWAERGHPVYVCDPDAAPGVWPGCRVVGGGDDYEAIARQLAVVDAEFQRRSRARSEGQRKFAPMHLVIDEVQETIAHVPDTWEILEPIIRRGRKLGLHVTLGVQDNQVETLDLDGKSHLLHNLVTTELFVDERGQRTARIKGRTASGVTTFAVPQLLDPETLIVERPMTGVTQPLQVAAPAAEPPPTQVIRQAPAPVLAARPAAAPPDPLLSALLDMDLGAVSPERRARLDAILAREVSPAPPAPPSEVVTSISRGEGEGLTVNVGVAVLPSPPASAPAPGRERKRLTLAELRARREWARYYQRAARARIPFDQAYKAAPVKGNRNRAHAVYVAARDNPAS